MKELITVEQVLVTPMQDGIIRAAVDEWYWKRTCIKRAIETMTDENRFDAMNGLKAGRDVILRRAISRIRDQEAAENARRREKFARISREIDDAISEYYRNRYDSNKESFRGRVNSKKKSLEKIGKAAFEPKIIFTAREKKVPYVNKGLEEANSKGYYSVKQIMEHYKQSRSWTLQQLRANGAEPLRIGRNTYYQMKHGKVYDPMKWNSHEPG